MKKNVLDVARVGLILVVALLVITYGTLISVDVIIAPSAAHAYITEMTGESVQNNSIFLKSEVVKDKRLAKSIKVLNKHGYHIVILNK